MSWTKKIIRGLGYFAYLTFAVAILLEIIFRILPVSDSMRVLPVNDSNPILRFKENRTVNKQIGFDFTHVNVKNINNYGFATDKEFIAQQQTSKKLIAVIGDSYVEAVQVDNSDTFHAILDDEIKSINVYPIGISGSPLSQYLAYARYAKRQFNPDVFVFLLISNDFDQSWHEIHQSQGFHYFNKEGSLVLEEYQPSLLKSLARNSAFLRYLHLDLKLSVQLEKMLNYNENIETPVVKNSNKREQLGMKAIDFFISEIGTIANNKKVILMLDGDRSAIYKGNRMRDPRKIENHWYERVISQVGMKENLMMLDLHIHFLNNWNDSQKKFNYDYDYHWNEHGHQIAAKALAHKLQEVLK
jgi:hypothetical protein